MPATTSTRGFSRLDDEAPPVAYFREMAEIGRGQRRTISIAAPMEDPELQKVARATPLPI